MTTAGPDRARPWDRAFSYARDRSALGDAVHIFVLMAFAVAQPVYDLLGRNAEFFVAHRSTRGDILTLVLLLSVGLPAAIALVRFLVGLVSSRAGNALHALIVFGGVTLMVLPVLNQVAAWPGVLQLLIACAIGFGATVAYWRIAAVRTMASVLSPAAVLFPLLFLFNTPVARLIVPPENPRLGEVSGSLDTPIVVVVFDELSTVDLMDADRQIDAHRFPNLAGLAATSYWFRNATAVADNTMYGVPAILTGRYPPQEELVPTIGDHPENLFTLLGGTHDLDIVETVTRLCPGTICNESSEDGVVERSAVLLMDTGIVFLNRVVPKDLASWLPAVSTGWGNFVPDPQLFRDGAWLSQFASTVADDRAAVFESFVERLGTPTGRSLRFIHTLLPHEPLTYMPSGQMYWAGPSRGRTQGDNDRWMDDAAAMRVTHQRYLLQAQFVDTLVGEVVERLKSAGTFDESLLIVMADHGVSFKPGGFRRGFTDDNHVELMAMPLFVKLPNQQEGVVSDRNVQTIDVVPTIADVIGVSVPWHIDGTSALDTSAAELPQKTIVLLHGKRRRTFDAQLVEELAPTPAIGRGSDDRFAIFREGEFGDLVGLDAAPMMEAAASDAGTASIEQRVQFDYVDRASGYVPTYITGSVVTAGRSTPSLDVAVVVNGRIAAVSRAFAEDQDRFSFEAIIPEEMLVEGHNTPAICIIAENDGGGPALRPLTGAASLEPPPATVVWGDDGDAAIRIGSGDGLPVVVDGIDGGANLTVQRSLVTFTGWAFDRTERTPFERVLLFVDGEQVASASQRVDRPGVVTALNDELALNTGFLLSVPVAVLRRSARPIVELYAVFPRGVTTPLRFDDRSRASLVEAIGGGRSYELQEVGDELAVRTDNGSVEPVTGPPITARIQRSAVQGDRVVVQGFAVDEARHESPLDLYVFVGADLLHAGGFWVRSASVPPVYRGGAAMSHSAFQFDVPLSAVIGIDANDVRFIGRFRDGSLRLLQFDRPITVEGWP